MNIFVAGASGAIGRPLLAELVRQGHAVTGMTNSDAGARVIAGLGAAVARVSAFDAPALERALRESRAEVVIDELTALPRHPSEMAALSATASCASAVIARAKRVRAEHLRAVPETQHRRQPLVGLLLPSTPCPLQ